MSKPIEIRLRIPKNNKAPILDDGGYPLDMASVRFRKAMSVAAIPKTGETIELTAGSRTFSATVTMTDWSESDGRFVVACQYGQRSISVDDQNALVADAEWQLTPLV
jgi:hypothetical protein